MPLDQFTQGEAVGLAADKKQWLSPRCGCLRMLEKRSGRRKAIPWNNRSNEVAGMLDAHT